MTETTDKSIQSGTLTASLAAPSEQYDLAFLVARINDNIKPPTAVSEQDVFIRAVYLVSDAVNAYGGRFPADEHPRLADLMVDAPVLVGHRKDHLPVGRNFHAVVEVKEGQSWVKSYFYWLRSSEGALSLRDNIDGGIYKECSIGFMYGLAECSVCGSDMRACRHQTTQDGSVWFNYRQIQRVLETSLVYRGATPDTSISKNLQVDKWEGQASQIQPRGWNPKPVADLRDLDTASEYVVVPAYAGIPVLVNLGESLFEARDLENRVLLSLLLNGKAAGNVRSIKSLEGFLVGMRGKDRCTVAETELFVHKGRGPVSRLELRLFPNDEQTVDSLPARCGELTVRKMRSTIATIADLKSACRNLQTREGVYLWRKGSSPFHSCVHSVTLGEFRDISGSTTSAQIQSADEVLDLNDGHSVRRFIKPKSFVSLIGAGKRLIVTEVANAKCVIAPNETTVRDGIKGFECFLADAQIRVHVRPLRVHGALKYLIYKSPVAARVGSLATTGVGR
ncbi:MAG: hypothetical protein AAB305_07515 [Candidatus Zixiibacteriota bacterium]